MAIVIELCEGPKDGDIHSMKGTIEEHLIVEFTTHLIVEFTTQPIADDKGVMGQPVRIAYSYDSTRLTASGHLRYVWLH